MKKFAPLALVLALVPMTASAERAYSVTGENGGSATGTIACSNLDGTVTCVRNGVAVTPEGVEIDKAATRILTRESSEVTVTSTGPNGRVLTKTRNFNR